MIPGSGNMSPQGSSPPQMENHQHGVTNGGFLGHQNQLGLLDLTPTKSGPQEINRLKEELAGARTVLANWEDGFFQARNACEAWKKEAAMAKQKADVAMKEKESAMAKAAQMQRELEVMSGGPHLHAIKRVSELKSLPLNMLKALEMQLKKDLLEVEKV